eukprot:2822085-Pleurochrysis_carterae.AAC.1
MAANELLASRVKQAECSGGVTGSEVGASGSAALPSSSAGDPQRQQVARYLSARVEYTKECLALVARWRDLLRCVYRWQLAPETAAAQYSMAQPTQPHALLRDAHGCLQSALAHALAAAARLDLEVRAAAAASACEASKPERASTDRSNSEAVPAPVVAEGSRMQGRQKSQPQSQPSTLEQHTVSVRKFKKQLCVYLDSCTSPEEQAALSFEDMRLDFARIFSAARSSNEALTHFCGNLFPSDKVQPVPSDLYPVAWPVLTGVDLARCVEATPVGACGSRWLPCVVCPVVNTL